MTFANGRLAIHSTCLRRRSIPKSQRYVFSPPHTLTASTPTFLLSARNPMTLLRQVLPSPKYVRHRRTARPIYTTELHECLCS